MREPGCGFPEVSSAQAFRMRSRNICGASCLRPPESPDLRLCLKVCLNVDRHDAGVAVRKFVDRVAVVPRM